MSRKKIKQVDAIRQKTLETVIEEFLRHCRLKNLSPRTLEYYEEDLSYFQRTLVLNPDIYLLPLCNSLAYIEKTPLGEEDIPIINVLP